MSKSYLQYLNEETEKLQQTGLYKSERIISSPQGAHIRLTDGSEVINLCANNYLGLANHPGLISAAHAALDQYGYGMSSVRFICGTQNIHKDLESEISNFLGTEDTILYSSCFDANTGLFETLLSYQDAVISDELNHASIIDGVRLCKAKRFRYANNDMAALEHRLQESQDCRFRLIATDGVFSMDGSMANLPVICDLAETYDAMVMVDDSHAVGFIGDSGAGTPEYFGVTDRVHLVTGTLGKALGGASGGYTSGRKEIITWLRQRSRPYLFSNTLAPVIAATSVSALKLIKEQPEQRRKLEENSSYFRQQMATLGFELLPGKHPIIPVMLGDATLAVKMSELMLDKGVYVIAFSYPVVPEGKARIRTQMSAAMDKADIDTALQAFAEAGRTLGVIQ